MNDDEGSGSFAFAGQPAVDHPAAFCWHSSSKKNRPSWCLFPFRMAPVLPLRTAWIADILSQASLRDVERHRCWKRSSGDGLRLWDYCTARLSDLSMPLTSEVRCSPEPSARPSAAVYSEVRQICTTSQTQPEKICKLQSTIQYNVRCEWHWFVRCDLQIFSGCVCHLEQRHAQSLFLFPIVFSIIYHYI